MVSKAIVFVIILCILLILWEHSFSDSSPKSEPLRVSDEHEDCGGRKGDSISCGHAVQVECVDKYDTQVVASGGVINGLIFTAEHVFRNVTSVLEHCSVKVGWASKSGCEIKDVYWPLNPNNYDVALLRIPFNDCRELQNVPQLKFSKKDINFHDLRRKPLHFCGYGFINSVTYAQFPKDISMTLLTHHECGLQETDVDKDKDQVCAAANYYEGITCPGDSGGILTMTNGKGLKVPVGVLSRGKRNECLCLEDDNNPNVFTLISPNLLTKNFPNVNFGFNNAHSFRSNLSHTHILILIFLIVNLISTFETDVLDLENWVV